MFVVVIVFVEKTQVETKIQMNYNLGRVEVVFVEVVLVVVVVRFVVDNTEAYLHRDNMRANKLIDHTKVLGLWCF